MSGWEGRPGEKAMKNMRLTNFRFMNTRDLLRFDSKPGHHL